MNIVVDKAGQTPLYWQIADQIKEKILSGTWPDGMILPSERVLAKETGVHRNTVIKAYSSLKDEELIESFQGVGYRVACHSDEEALCGNSGGGTTVNWSTLIKDEYQDMESTFDDYFQHFAESAAISFSTGMPASVYDETKAAADLAKILTEENRKPFYLTPYQGDQALRQKIIAYLRMKGIRANLGQVQVLSETNQALDFLVTAMVKPGDKVLLEEPVSPDVFRIIELAGGTVITVPMDEEGMLCGGLDGLLQQHKPKFIYLNSSYHDPTGKIASVEKRRKLLALSKSHRVPIVEEDAASGLGFDGEMYPTIKSMDDGENVIYIYSFSLTFMPGLSMAFVVAPEKLIKSLSYLVSIRMMSLDWMTQKLLAKYLDDGTYAENLQKLRQRNKTSCALMCSYLDQLKPLGLTYQKPKGGVYIWVRLPDGMDSREIVRLCEKQGVTMMPGTIFYPKKNQGYHHIRLNYSFETEARIREGMEIFVQTVETATKNV